MTKKKPKSEHKKTGRPTIMTPQVIAKLEHCFERGYSDYDAYKSVGISKDAFYDYCVANPDFSEKKEWLKKNTVILSKNIVYDKLVIDKDINTAKFILERKCKDEFSLKTETELSGEVKSKVVYIEKEEKEAYKKHIDEVIDGD
jgi:hypothetical protein